MRNAFMSTLIELAKEDERLFLLVGDLGYSVVEPFIEKFSNRFINVGVAEQNLIGIAAGLALSGKIVFVYSLANFPTLRCLEQIRNDLCYHNANVKIVAIGAGVTYGTHGITHFATEDIAIMRALPNMTVIAPGDPIEVSQATKAIVAINSPCYLRLGKGGEPNIHVAPVKYEIGKGLILREGKDAALITTSNMLQETVQAAECLAQEGIFVRVISMHTLKPIDKILIAESAKKCNHILTIEEHGSIGGLGAAVAEVLVTLKGKRPIFHQLSLSDTNWKTLGCQQYLRKIAGLTQANIVSLVRKFSKNRKARNE